MFDARKLERVFFNLILNACEATAETDGSIVVDAKIRHRDLKSACTTPVTHSTGIRDSLFDPS